MLALDANQRITPSEVEAFLGEGGFGIVAKCRDTNTNQAVAIKVNKTAKVGSRSRQHCSMERLFP
uniref:Homeodomain-interacting protein kinase 1-like n=1 Tax=Neolamprologus brichardi TaxID=32507 RepID=A0A3Q4GWX9_NEOBR